MGTWGPSLYSDDTTCEVRDEFKAFLEEGMSHEAAAQKIIERFSDLLNDHEIACLVYFALADTLWKHGCLSDEIRLKTIALIDEGGDVRYWERDSPSDAKARYKCLQKLREKIQSEQPQLKLVKRKPKRPPKKQVDAAIGTVFCLPLPSGRLAALKFVGLQLVGKDEVAVFRMLPWVDRSMPTKNTLESIQEKVVEMPMIGSGMSFKVKDSFEPIKELVAKDYSEFAIYMSDGRKNPVQILARTDIVLSNLKPMDSCRYISIPAERLAIEIDAGFSME